MRHENKTKIKVKLTRGYAIVSPEDLAFYLKLTYTEQEMLEFLLSLGNERIINVKDLAKPLRTIFYKNMED